MQALCAADCRSLFIDCRSPERVGDHSVTAQLLRCIDSSEGSSNFEVRNLIRDAECAIERRTVECSSGSHLALISQQHAKKWLLIAGELISLLSRLDLTAF